LIEIVEDDGLIEEMFRYKEVGALGCPLRFAMRVELKSKMHLMQRIAVNFVFEYTVLIDNSLEIDPHLNRP
jgi:hypothetical protein